MSPEISSRHEVIDHLRRRNKRSLIVFSVISLLLVGAAELAAFRFNMVERYGIEPVLLRAALYIFLSVLLWARLLRNDRQRIDGLLRRNEEYFRSLLYAYEGALGLKDWYTGGHGRRVARYSQIIAILLELPPQQTQRIEYAALLHDIGKIGVPDTILTKSGTLSTEEWEKMKGHAATGAELVAKTGVLQNLAPLIRGHHERVDGQGYPDKLATEDIPLGARIIAVADTFDAITTSRSYRVAASFTKALSELKKNAGVKFDSIIVATILSPQGQTALEAEYGRLKAIRS